MLGRLKFFVIQKLTKHLVRAIDDEDLLKMSSRSWFVGNYKLTPDEIDRIKTEADYILNSHAWKFAVKGLQSEAWQKIRSHENGMDIIFSEAMYYNLEHLEEYLKKMRGL